MARASRTPIAPSAKRWARENALAAVLVVALVGVVGLAHVAVAPAGHTSPSLLAVLIGLWAITTILSLGGAYASVVGYLDSGARVDVAILPEDERRILELILDAPGVTQVEVVDRSGFSDAKVSQTLKAMRERGLVYREPQGRTYRLYPGSVLGGATNASRSSA